MKPTSWLVAFTSTTSGTPVGTIVAMTVPAETISPALLTLSSAIVPATGIVTDASLRTSEPDIYAAGDVASWASTLLGRRIRVEHWANALNGGAAAGRSMLDDPAP